MICGQTCSENASSELGYQLIQLFLRMRSSQSMTYRIVGMFVVLARHTSITPCAFLYSLKVKSELKDTIFESVKATNTKTTEVLYTRGFQHCFAQKSIRMDQCRDVIYNLYKHTYIFMRAYLRGRPGMLDPQTPKKQYFVL